MTDEKDEKAVEPTEDHADNIEDAVVVEDVQEVVSDEPSEDAVADGVEAIDTERKSSGVLAIGRCRIYLRWAWIWCCDFVPTF
jgi:hypothetical protein